MTSPDQELWTRVKERLRAEVGPEVFSSWFARMDLESTEDDTVKHSVPTRFLKSWIQSHYAERLLTCWQKEQPAIRRIELTVRSAVLRTSARPGAMAASRAPPSRRSRPRTRRSAARRSIRA